MINLGIQAREKAARLKNMAVELKEKEVFANRPNPFKSEDKMAELAVEINGGLTERK